MCPFSILAFLQPTTVDKEPKKSIQMHGFTCLKIYIYATSQVKPFQIDNLSVAILFDGPHSRGEKYL